MLWDMTGEKDVVKFLLDNDFLQIAEFTLKVSNEPRLTVKIQMKFLVSIKINKNYFLNFTLRVFIMFKNKYK